MFRRIMVANRGEVAARIVRTANRMGIETVAVASTADSNAGWLKEATTVVTIGGPRPADSYLNVNALIEVARHHRCAAVHPGWGFLAENAQFAQQCQAVGLTFIGPDAHHLRIMGDKSMARSTMADAGLAPIPGSKAVLRSVDEARTVAKDVGYPLLLKAVAGGGGRGMRGVESEKGLEAAFMEASTEAESNFADGRLYAERLITEGRHVEVQIIADNYGNVLHLGERECSIQRRHQKVLEEAPSPALTPESRESLLAEVTEAVRKVGYRGAGTVEMLVDQNGEAWFMEMNTRLQVEHPVTEMTTGLDLVELQLRVAAGERLAIEQKQVIRNGYSIECRINAEDPDRGFAPSPGQVTHLKLPKGSGIRVDTHLRSGDKIPPFYDSMVAKIITHAPSREKAIALMLKALTDTQVEGVTTNIELHRTLLQWEPFVSGRYNTNSLERYLATEDKR